MGQARDPHEAEPLMKNLSVVVGRFQSGTRPGGPGTPINEKGEFPCSVRSLLAPRQGPDRIWGRLEQLFTGRRI